MYLGYPNFGVLIGGSRGVTPATADVAPRLAAMPQNAATELPGPSESFERAARILDFERRDWPHPGAKEEAIRVELGLNSARYYQLLNAVIESPTALAQDPMLVRRLRRIRDGRRHA
jgi:hypothetical protein